MNNLLIFSAVTLLAAPSFADAKKNQTKLEQSCDRYSAEGCLWTRIAFDSCKYKNTNTKEASLTEYALSISGENSIMRILINSDESSANNDLGKTTVLANVQNIPNNPKFFCLLGEPIYNPTRRWMCFGQDSMNEYGDTLYLDLSDENCEQVTSNEESKD